MADLEADQNQTSNKKVDTPVVEKKSSNKTLIIVLAIVGVLVILPGLLLAVGAFWLSRGDNAEKLTENIIETASDADVDINSQDKSFTVKTEEGSISAQSGEELAEDFPEAVILYDKQTITGTFNQTSDTQKSWSVTAETNETPDTVGSYFSEKYSDWENSGSYTYETVKGYTFSKDNLTVVLAVTKDDGDEKTSINYTVNQEL